MDHPLISVIIPAYNAGRYLGEALISVFGQDYSPMEVIVVDDGSTDETAAVAQSYSGVIYTCQSNKGPAAARNTGIGMAHGDFIAFLDADDLWPPDRLKIQVPYFIADPNIEVVLGRIQCTGLLTEDEKKKIRFEGPDNTMINICLGSGIFKRSVFDRVGFFDESLRLCEDHDWFLRAREQDVSMIIPKLVTLLNRRHWNSMSRKRKKTDPTMMQILQKSLERRRKQHNGFAPPLKKFFDYDEGRV
jgi:glycosyltransferase involved in cell wall biosynthesis